MWGWARTRRRARRQLAPRGSARAATWHLALGLLRGAQAIARSAYRTWRSGPAQSSAPGPARPRTRISRSSRRSASRPHSPDGPPGTRPSDAANHARRHGPSPVRTEGSAVQGRAGPCRAGGAGAGRCRGRAVQAVQGP